MGRKNYFKKRWEEHSQNRPSKPEELNTDQQAAEPNAVETIAMQITRSADVVASPAGQKLMKKKPQQ